MLRKKNSKNQDVPVKIDKDSISPFVSALPQKLDWFSSFFLKRLYTGIKLDDNQIAVLKNLPHDAIIVYANKHHNNFEFLFYYTRFRELGLPYPLFAFDHRIILWQPLRKLGKTISHNLRYFVRHFSLPDPYRNDFFKSQLLECNAGLLSLVSPKGFYRRFVKSQTDPILFLIELQRSTERPIIIVPQLMFFGKRPQRSVPTLIDILFGSEQRPGRFRRLFSLIRNPGKVFVEISRPINLKSFLDQKALQELEPDDVARRLRLNLLLQFNRHRQSIVGPILKTREEMKENILNSDELQRFMVNHATSRQITRQQVRKKADGDLEEIAAQFNVTMIRITSVFMKWIIGLMYDGFTVNRDILTQVKKMALRGPVIFIPCHKSHVDYLVTPYILYHNDLPVPHVAAGKNLSFWPLGPFFRSCGAFFIRRTFKGAVLYSKVFAAYVHWLLSEGFNIKFYIEGTRSRTGKLLVPKLGFLSILLDAIKKGASDDLIFAPIFIGYDQVLEEKAYLHEIEGGQKQKENFGQVIKARKFLRKRWGRIYVRFHDPISLSDLLEQQGTSLTDLNNKEFNTLCRHIGIKVLNAIDRMTVVTAHGLVAATILNLGLKRFSYHMLMEYIDVCINYLVNQDIELAETLMFDQQKAVDIALESYIHRKFIEREPVIEEKPPQLSMFKIKTSRRPILEYYKNNCIALFIPAAFTASAILERDAFQFTTTELHDGYTTLQEFFKNEFAADADKPPAYFLRKTIKTFIDDAILMPHATLPDTYNITSLGFRKLKFYASFLKTFFESYLVVLTFFKQKSRNAIKPKDRIKKIGALGNRMYRQGIIERIEALSKVNYQNAVDYYVGHGIRGSEDQEKIETLNIIIGKYLRLLPPT